MNTKYTEYKINPEKSSQSAARTFDLVFKIVSQDEVPPPIKVKNLFPEYILKPNVAKGRRKFTNSFFLPISENKWRSLYNIKSTILTNRIFKFRERKLC